MLIDTFQRQITYLRVSVTDRCNLRCVYCMPQEGIAWKAHDGIMRYEEIADFVRLAAEHGIREVRLTGGEPLVRPNLNVLVEMLSAIPQIEDLSLTTNALLLEKYAQPLKDAGLNRVNISLDTLDPEKFRKITRGGSFEQAWKGILAAERAGLTPIKINAVIMRGVNDDEILDLARLTLDHPWQLRFIELMPLGNQMPWGDGFPSPETAYISLEDIYQRIEPIGLEPVNGKLGNGPAVEYQLTGGKGIIGFISPLSEQHFCSRCNRMRLTADGYLRPCLMSDLEIPILPAMRAGESILPLLEKAVGLKPSGHKLGQQRAPDGRSMAQIGG